MRPKPHVAVLAACLFVFLPLRAFAPDIGGVDFALDSQLGLTADEGRSLVSDMKASAGAAGRTAANLLKALKAAHRIVAQLGYDVDLDVRYEPTDAPDAIHLRHEPDEDYRKHRIVMEAKVKFTGDASGVLQAPETRSVRKLLGIDLPDNGAVKNMRVRWYIDPALLRWVEVGGESFDGGQLPIWSSYTDASGVARGTIYPVLEQPYLGGVKRIEEGEIRAKAQVQTAQGVPKDPVSAGAVIADEFLTTAETTRKIRIERHVPTEWVGTVTVTRSISGAWNVRRPIPSDKADQLGLFSTTFSGNEYWDSVATITGIRLNTNGVGSGKYTLKLDATQRVLSLKQGKISCDGGIKSAKDELDVNCSGKGEENGNASLRIEVDTDKKPHRYAVIVDAPGLGMQAMLPPLFASSGKSVHTWTDCNGTKSVTNPAELRSRLIVSQILQSVSLVPRVDWPVLDRDARSLSDTLVWSQTLKAAPEAPEVTVVNTVQWKLDRVMPEGAK